MVCLCDTQVCLGLPDGVKERLRPSGRLIEHSPGGGEGVLSHPGVSAGIARVTKLGCEVAPLGDCRRVGSVVGEDLLENVAGLVGFVGDDEQAVLLSSPSRAHVEASVAGGGSDDGEADVHRVALVAVGGGCVAEPQVRACVVGGQRPLAKASTR